MSPTRLYRGTSRSSSLARVDVEHLLVQLERFFVLLFLLELGGLFFSFAILDI